jgi:hypothetical protein
MDASAIMQNDSRPENVRAMTEFAREAGVYSSGASTSPAKEPQPGEARAASGNGHGMSGRPEPRIKPGVCVPWEDKERELPEISGDREIFRNVWETADGLGNMYIWQCLLSF